VRQFSKVSAQLSRLGGVDSASTLRQAATNLKCQTMRGTDEGKTASGY
jgi:hypothetical protein